MRAVTLTALEAILAPQTDQAFVFLLEIEHPNLSEPIRVTDNEANLVSNDELYLAFPFRIALPTDQEDQIPSVHIVIDNVDRRIAEAVESINTPADLTFRLVRAEDPDTIEAGPWSYKFRNISYDAFQVEATVTNEDILNEPFPKDIFSPATTPGIFSEVIED